MKKAIAIIAAAVVSVAALTQVTSAGPGPGYGPGAGWGPGMMSPGWGMMGPNMMGRGWGFDVMPSDLTAEQRSKILDIQRDMRARQWPLMQQMHELMAAGGAAQDDQAQRQAYDSVAALQKQMFENMLDARKRIDGVLTPQQRDEFRRGWGPR